MVPFESCDCFRPTLAMVCMVQLRISAPRKNVMGSHYDSNMNEMKSLIPHLLGDGPIIYRSWFHLLLPFNSP